MNVMNNVCMVFTCVTATLFVLMLMHIARIIVFVHKGKYDDKYYAREEAKSKVVVYKKDLIFLSTTITICGFITFILSLINFLLF